MPPLCRASSAIPLNRPLCRLVMPSAPRNRCPSRQPCASTRPRGSSLWSPPSRHRTPPVSLWPAFSMRSRGKPPFGLSLSKPCAALRHAYSVPVERLRAANKAHRSGPGYAFRRRQYKWYDKTDPQRQGSFVSPSRVTGSSGSRLDQQSAPSSAGLCAHRNTFAAPRRTRCQAQMLRQTASCWSAA